MTTLLLAVIYLAFISLGLPDSVLGAAWPTIFPAFQVANSNMGILSMTIALGTIVSSLQSDRWTKKFGTHKVTAFSVLATAAALIGFATSPNFWVMWLWTLPYGLGAGSVDTALNNYVALHYSSKHMSWLHCMWGVGAAFSPVLMGYALTSGAGWRSGYLYVFVIQIVVAAVLFLSFPLWKSKLPGGDNQENMEKNEKSLTLMEIFALPGAKRIMIAFFCYCGLEQTAGLWASSYLVMAQGLSEERAASWASLFFLGVTAGRFFSGFLTMKFSDRQMILGGSGLIGLGIAVLMCPLGAYGALAGLLLIGGGCAPIFPCIIHSTPANFGAEYAHAVTGVQMACAYVGILAVPPLFGVLARYFTMGLFPTYMGVLLVLMILAYRGMKPEE